MVPVETKTIGAVADYATFALFESAERTDLVAADKVIRPAFKDELHTAPAVIFAGWNTDADHYIWMDVEDAAARHDGVAGTGARLITANNVPLIIQGLAHVHVTWLEMADTVPSNSRPCVRINTSAASGCRLHMDKLILHEQGMGFFIQAGTNDCTVDLVDTMIYNGNRIGIRLEGTGHTLRIYNDVVWNVGRAGATFSALHIDSPTTTTVDLRDSLLHVGNVSADVLSLNGAGDPWDPGCNKNVLSDASGTAEGLPGTKIESAAFQAGAGGVGDRVMFENLTAGLEDLHLFDPPTQADNAAVAFGDNLTGEVFPENISIEVDIDGVTRGVAGPWDAGAHQLSVFVPAPPAPDPTTSGGRSDFPRQPFTQPADARRRAVNFHSRRRRRSLGGVPELFRTHALAIPTTPLPATSFPLRTSPVTLETAIRITANSGVHRGLIFELGDATTAIAAWVDDDSISLRAGDGGADGALAAFSTGSGELPVGQVFDLVFSVRPGDGRLQVWGGSVTLASKQSSSGTMPNGWAASSNGAFASAAVGALPADVLRTGAPDGFEVIRPLSIYVGQVPRHFTGIEA